MSIVRMGMSEDGKFGEGYDAIFGKKTATAKKSVAKKPAVKKTAAPKPVAKKATATKKK